MPTIAAIEGIGHRNATRLRKARIRTTEALLKRGGTRRGRREVAQATGLGEKQILQWVNRADLMRVKGIGEEYSDLLEHAGVDTVKELKNRKPANLHAKMVDINRTKRLVRRLPTESMVEAWVDHAKKLKAIVSH